MNKILPLMLAVLAATFPVSGSQQVIGTGTTANDGTGDPLRTAFTKVNANFTEVYGQTTALIANTNLLTYLTETRAVNHSVAGSVFGGTFTGTHSGNGSALTSLTAGNLTGALPAISGAALTALTAANITAGG